MTTTVLFSFFFLLVTTTVLNTKIGEVDNKTLNHANYITNQEFNKLTAESFKERLKKLI